MQSLGCPAAQEPDGGAMDDDPSRYLVVAIYNG